MATIEIQTREIITDYLETVNIAIERAKQDSSPWPLIASGKSKNETKIVKGSKPGQILYLAPGYLFTLFEGVGIGKNKIFPWAQITQWLRFKPISGVRDERGRFLPRRELAFLIAEKIWRLGSGVFRGTRTGVPIEKILEDNLPETGTKIAKAYQQEMLKQIRLATK